MSPLTEDQWRKLARELAERLDLEVPGWADVRDSDPGVTLAQVFAFVADELLFRTNQIPERGRAAIRRIIDELAMLRELPCPECGGLERVRYFDGQLLTSADLQAEQDYVRAKLRCHNIGLHGAGVVAGLKVTVESSPESGGAVVRVGPGFAIAPDGEELLVCEPLTSAPCADDSPCYVTVKRAERLIKAVPAVSGMEPSRIEEGVAVEVGVDIPAGGVTIARLNREGAIWWLDPNFQPPRAR